MRNFDYPYSEFRSHFAAMSTVREYETARPSYDREGDDKILQIGGDKSFEATAFRTLDYFAQVIPDTARRRYVSHRFIMAMTYMAQHAEKFSDASLAELPDPESNDSPAMISEAVLLAVHKLYVEPWTENNLCPDPEPSAEEVVALAKSINESDDGNE